MQQIVADTWSSMTPNITRWEFHILLVAVVERLDPCKNLASNSKHPFFLTSRTVVAVMVGLSNSKWHVRYLFIQSTLLHHNFMRFDLSGLKIKRSRAKFSETCICSRHCTDDNRLCLRYRLFIDNRNLLFTKCMSVSQASFALSFQPSACTRSLAFPNSTSIKQIAICAHENYLYISSLVKIRHYDAVYLVSHCYFAFKPPLSPFCPFCYMIA